MESPAYPIAKRLRAARTATQNVSRAIVDRPARLKVESAAALLDEALAMLDDVTPSSSPTPASRRSLP